MYSEFMVLQDQCLECNNLVLKTLGTLQGVFEVELNRIDGQIVVSHTDEVTRDEIAETLYKLGFVEVKQAEETIQDEPSGCGCIY